jgi:prolyl-tRNA editing enzyme YbaK/EbsC (Cys-tRNA(Pro) deacylase)
MAGGAERVRAFLKEQGIPVEMKEFDESTKSSSLAAAALGCEVAQIAKSVVFAGGGRCYVVILSGDRRVDPAKLSAAVGAPAAVATADQVREMTGYAIGGVPPFPHTPGVVVLPDSSLARFEAVWAAGGTPNTVFRVRSRDLFEAVGRPPVDLSRVSTQRI